MEDKTNFCYRPKEKTTTNKPQNKTRQDKKTTIRENQEDQSKNEGINMQKENEENKYKS